MDLSISGIVAFVTLVLGEATKKLGLVNKKFIPIQSIVVGLLSGLICWLTELEPNIYSAMIQCVIASLSASGIYDACKIKKGE